MWGRLERDTKRACWLFVVVKCYHPGKNYDEIRPEKIDVKEMDLSRLSESAAGQLLLYPGLTDGNCIGQRGDDQAHRLHSQSLEPRPWLMTSLSALTRKNRRIMSQWWLRNLCIVISEEQNSYIKSRYLSCLQFLAWISRDELALKKTGYIWNHYNDNVVDWTGLHTIDIEAATLSDISECVKYFTIRNWL